MQINQTGPISHINVQTLDLETAMMMIQSQRADILESQLKDQMITVQQRNQDITKLNQVMDKLRTIQSAMAEKKDTDTINDVIKADDYKLEREINTLLHETEVQSTGTSSDKTGRMIMADGKSQNTSWTGSLCGSYTKAEVNALMDSVKSAMEGKNSSQQMDMLRMQSLTNKRNEAFDLMSNFVKKMSDSRSSIVGNMR